MAGATDLIVRILVDESDVDRGLNSAQGSVTRWSGGLGAATVASTAALGGLFAGTAAAATAAVDAEQSTQQLQFALDKFPLTADTSAEALGKLNTALSLKTRYDDDAIGSGQAVLAQFGLTGSQIEQLTPLMLDYAAKTQQDAPAAAESLGKALLGQGRALKDVGIDFQDTGSLLGNYGQLVDGLTNQVGGYAEAQGDTAAGKIDIFNHALENLMETIGTDLIPALSDLADQGTRAVEWASENKELIKGVAIVTGTLAGAVLLASGAYKGLAFVQGLAGMFGLIRGATVLSTGATVANTTAVAANNVAWYASPVTWIILAIVAAIAGLVAAGILLVQNWDGVVKFFSEAWTNISTGAGVAFQWIGEQAQGFVDGILSIPQRIGEAFSGLGDMLRTVAHTVASAIAWLWNNSVGKIAFDVPGWVPFIGGQRFAVPQIVVPALAAGGVVTAATLALIGEAGPEAVIPLPQYRALLDGQADPSRGFSSGDLVIEVHHQSTLDGRVIYESVERHKRKRK